MRTLKLSTVKWLRAFCLLIRQDLPRGNPVKLYITLAKAPPWLSQMKKPLRLCYSAYLRMAAKLSAVFLWKCPANDSAKTGITEMSRRTNGKIQECRARGQGGGNPHWQS